MSYTARVLGHRLAPKFAESLKVFFLFPFFLSVYLVEVESAV